MQSVWKKNAETLKRQASQIKRHDKIKMLHSLKSEGYTQTQIAKQMEISRCTVRRLLHIAPEQMCVDGTQTQERPKQLDPYKEQIQELIERGFQTTQIIKKLQEVYSDLKIKRSTMKYYCTKLRMKMYDYTQSQKKTNVPDINNDSILFAYIDKIKQMLNENQPLTVILAAIKTEGYTGSYSLLQQHCLVMKPATYQIKKAFRSIKRKDLVSATWSGETDVSDNDIAYIDANFPVFVEIRAAVTEFRKAYSDKDVNAVKLWCDKYAQCDFPAICSFINGINQDADAFYNSMKYEYSNGLLEGSVNKLKTVKRSMYGRAGYPLLRAKLLLLNHA